MSAMVSPARRSAFSELSIGPSPIIAGSQPDTAKLATRASGVRPWRRTKASEQTITAVAPSVMGEDVPAVTVPFSRNTVRNPAS